MATQCYVYPSSFRFVILQSRESTFNSPKEKILFEFSTGKKKNPYQNLSHTRDLLLFQKSNKTLLSLDAVQGGMKANISTSGLNYFKSDANFTCLVYAMLTEDPC